MLNVRTRGRVRTLLGAFVITCVSLRPAHAQLSLLGAVGDPGPGLFKYDPVSHLYFGVDGLFGSVAPCVTASNLTTCVSPRTAGPALDGLVTRFFLIDGRFEPLLMPGAFPGGVPVPAPTAPPVAEFGPAVSDANGVGGFLVVFKTDVRVIACAVSSATLQAVVRRESIVPPCNAQATVIGDYAGLRAPRIAYLSSQKQFLVAWPDEAAHTLVVRRVGSDGRGIGAPAVLQNACGAFDVTADPTRDRWAIAAWSCRQETNALRFVSIAATGAVLGDQVVSTASGATFRVDCCFSAHYVDAPNDGSVAIGFSVTTGTYVVAYWNVGSPALQLAELTAAGQVTSRGQSTGMRSGTPLALSYNSVTQSFLLSGVFTDSAGHDSLRGLELNRHGAVLSAFGPLASVGQSSVYQLSIASRPDVPEWFAQIKVSSSPYVTQAVLIGGTTSPASDDQRLGACQTPDPFTAIGGGACLGGGWTPLASVPPLPAFVGTPWVTLTLDERTDGAGLRGATTLTVTNSGSATARRVTVVVPWLDASPSPSGSQPPGWTFEMRDGGDRFERFPYGLFQGDLASGASVTLRVDATTWSRAYAQALNAETASPPSYAAPVVQLPHVAGLSRSAPLPSISQQLTPPSNLSIYEPAGVPELSAFVTIQGPFSASSRVVAFNSAGTVTQSREWPSSTTLPVLEYSPDVGDALHRGGALAAWTDYSTGTGQLLTRVVSGPSLELGPVNVVPGTYSGASALAYSKTSQRFLVVADSVNQRLSGRLLDVSGMLWGAAFDLDGYRADVVWNPVSNEFGLLRNEFDPATAESVSRLTRVSAGGVVLGSTTLGRSSSSVMAVNEETGTFVLALGGSGVTVVSVGADGVISGRARILPDEAQLRSLTYNPTTRSFLLRGTKSSSSSMLSFAIELNGAGAPVSAPITLASQYGWTVARLNAAGWLVLDGSLKAVESTLPQASPPAVLGGCLGADPFASAGGGACIDGGWAPRGATIPLTVRAPSSAPPVVDLDGDGIGDAFTYKPTSGQWSRWLSRSDGTFAGTDGAWSSDWTVSPARFDDDARTDMFVINETSGQWFKLINDGTAFVAQATGAWSTGWRRFVVDLNGDDRSDVFLWNAATGTWFKCLATPAGFSYEQGAWSPGWEVYPLGLNIDRAQDLLLFNRTSGQWFWALSVAAGGFQYSSPGYWSTDLTLHAGDFDGDGQSDLLLFRPSTGEWFNAHSGDGEFTYTSGSWTPNWSLTVGDFDGNGLDDVLLYRPDTGRWFEMVSTSSRGFENVAGGFWTPGWQISATRFDRDGRMDVLLYNSDTGVRFVARQSTLDAFTYDGGVWAPALKVVTGVLR